MAVRGSTPASWDDLTSGADPATVAPGPGAAVSIYGPTTGTLVVDRNGSASLLQIVNKVTLLNGSFSIGDTAIVAAASALVVGLATTLDTGVLNVGTSASAQVIGGTGLIDVSGTSTIAGDFTASDNGVAQLAGEVVLDGGTLNEADSGSSLTIGQGKHLILRPGDQSGWRARRQR